MQYSNLKVFSGSSNVELTNRICTRLSIKPGDIFRHTFPNGERYVQFKENIRGSDVFLVSCRDVNINNSLMELLVMADAARRASAGRITAVIPFFYYSRADRKDKSRVPISAKLIMDLIESSGIDRVVTMDLHSPQTGGFTNLPFDHLTFEPVLIDYIRKEYHSLALRDKVILMAPDVGAVKRVEKYSTILKSDFGFISKKRVGDEKVELQSIIGNVENKIAIIIDDMTESLGTLVQAAKECKRQGAIKVMCAVTHGCLTDTGIKRLLEADSIDVLVHSNTTDCWGKLKPNNVTELDVSETFAKAIFSIHNNESVSELFI